MARREHKRSPAPTLLDVVRSAQVSPSMTARVLRNDSYPVADERVRRVREAAARVGYVPNMMARTLRRGETALVGLVIGSMLDPYCGEIAQAVTNRCESSASLAAIVSNMRRDPLLEIEHCRQLWRHRVSGLILAGGGFDQVTHNREFTKLVSELQRAGIVVASLSPRGPDLPTFSVDNDRVGTLMAQRLVDAGHRRLGILMGPPQSEATRRRTAGVLRTLTAARAEWELLHTDYEPAAAPAAMETLMARSPHITGLIVGADSLGLGVTEWLNQRGLIVPDQMSVVAVGNTRIGQLLRPRLATVDVSLQACAEAAVDFVAGQVNGNASEPRRCYPIQLVAGETVGSPAFSRPWPTIIRCAPGECHENHKCSACAG